MGRDFSFQIKIRTNRVRQKKYRTHSVRSEMENIHYPFDLIEVITTGTVCAIAHARAAIKRICVNF